MKYLALVVFLLWCEVTADRACDSKPEIWVVSIYPLSTMNSVYILTLPKQKPSPFREADIYNFKFDVKALVVTDVTSDHCSIIATNKTTAVISCPIPKEKFTYDSLEFLIWGPTSGAVPHVKSIKQNNVELCANPITDYLDNYEQIFDYQLGKCGNRIIDYTDLIFNGMSTSPGEWPWHAAVYRLNTTGTRKYAGAGTLIKENFVLTAGHAVTKRNTKRPLAPQDLIVVLGKFYLEEPENTTQEIEVSEVIVHEKYNFPKHSDNDIALLKLLNDAFFNTYVQPACVFYDDISYKVPVGDVYGSVVGWGMDETISLSPQLKLAVEPERRYEECVRRDPLFYGQMLTNSSKFCAGWGNGTSPCNGDSGGGFMVYVPGPRHDVLPVNHGAWFIKGIVSLARTSVSNRGLRICDPNYYVIYTDVSKYSKWIGSHMHRPSLSELLDIGTSDVILKSNS